MAVFGKFSSHIILIWIIIIIIRYIRRLYTVWIKRGIPQLHAGFPFGNCGPIIRNTASYGDTFRAIYDKLKSKKLRLGGFYFGIKPDLMILDPELIKLVLVKDFQFFNSRGQFIDEKNDPLSAHLFNLHDLKWNILRKKLNPAFTGGKLKNMLPIFLSCSKEAEIQIENNIQHNKPIDIKKVTESFSRNIIASTVFGQEGKESKNNEKEFERISNLMFNATFIDKIKKVLQYCFPNIVNNFQIPVINKEVTKFFLTMTEKTVSYREKNHLSSKDFLDLFIQLKNKGHIDGSYDTENLDGIPTNEIAAHSYLFFLAGYETTSGTICFCLYELTQNIDVQDKLRMEIQEYLEKYEGHITYEMLGEMPYMDKVVHETLRKYPPLAFLIRQCIQDYTIPNTNITIEKGPSIVISVLGIHRDPQYYPDPDIFDPERFSDEEKSKRHTFTYLPFGEGPRTCIGMRFGLTKIKLALTVFLKNYKFRLNEKTTTPLRMAPCSYTLYPEGSIWMNVEKL